MADQVVQPGEQQMRLLPQLAGQRPRAGLERLQPGAQRAGFGGGAAPAPARSSRPRDIAARRLLTGISCNRSRTSWGLGGSQRYAQPTLPPAPGARGGTGNLGDIKMRRRTFLAAGAASLALPAVVRAQNQRVLKFIPQSDLAIVDPVWTTAYVTRNHGYMIFDTLYGQTGQSGGFKADAADGRRPHDRGRRQDLEADPARRADVPQRRQGAGARLRGLDQALGRARRVRPGTDAAHRRSVSAGRQDDRVPPEAAVRAAADALAMPPPTCAR